ncbi:MAG: EF-P beta-lysylation protein EpmB [Rubripirellula sp.]
MQASSGDDDSTSTQGPTAEILTTDGNFVPTALPIESVDWQSAMKRAIRSSSELRQILGLPESTEVAEIQGEADFPTFVPLEFLSRIRRGDPADPLLRQVLAIADEDISSPGFTADPVGDLPSLAAGGLIHKYENRALLITTGACGVHCRYCFRREFPYSDAGSRAQNWQPAIEYLKQHEEIDEVLLSGGDPLTLVDGKLDELISQLESIAHLKRLRFHSRMPIVIPQRITPELVKRLAASRLTVWFVVHANHVNELDEAVLSRLAMLIDAGIPVLNQAVLLRGVNDRADALSDLCLQLVNHRVQPYYLHQLDRVRGASHFEVPVEEGLNLMRQLRTRLPGYAVPSFVCEEAGQPSKTPIADNGTI